MLIDRLALVEALQSAVVPFVELPGPFDRQPHAVELIDDAPHRPNGPLEHRSVDDVEVEALSRSNALAAWASPSPCSLRSTTQPVNLFFLFQRLCPCRTSTSSFMHSFYRVQIDHHRSMIEDFQSGLPIDEDIEIRRDAAGLVSM